jgi:SHS2 domain-containing protein
MGRFRMKGHTADLALEVEGTSEVDLFTSAAEGLYRAIVRGRLKDRGLQHRVARSGADVEELLVGFLSELLYLYATQAFLAARIEITRWSEQEIEAELGGEAFDPRRHEALREIKAVTYHGLEVVRQGDRWRATIIMDV